MTRGLYRLEKPAMLAAVLRATRADPKAGPEVIAERLGLSHVTVRRYQRELGIYVPRGPGGRKVEARRE